jgi:hypothetical protein
MLNLTSQTWMTSAESSRPVWTHQLLVIVPDKINFKDTAAIYVTAGSNSQPPPAAPGPTDEDVLGSALLAMSTGEHRCPCLRSLSLLCSRVNSRPPFERPWGSSFLLSPVLSFPFTGLLGFYNSHHLSCSCPFVKPSPPPPPFALVLGSFFLFPCPHFLPSPAHASV